MKVMMVDESDIDELRIGHLMADRKNAIGSLSFDPDDVFMDIHYSVSQKIIEDWVELLEDISAHLESKNGGSIQ